MIVLTKREKLLIYILICFLLIVGGWYFLINPALENKTELEVQLANKQTELTTLKTQLESYQQAPTKLKELKKEYKNITKKYQSMLTNDNIDKLLTKEMLKVNLTPLTLNIGDKTNVNFTVTDNNTSTTTNNSSETTIIKQVEVTSTMDGSLSNVLKLINNLDDIQGVDIGYLNYSIIDSSTTTSNTTNNTISLNYVIYMIDK